MASLNTLRTQGGIIISVVIGIALIAFLMGDFVPRSCSDVTVGSIDGHKISYEEFFFHAEEYIQISQSMLGKEALTTEETEVARNMAWESLIAKYAYRPGLKKLGLNNSEAEQIDMVTGEYLSPIITGNFINQQTGLYEPAILSNFIERIAYDPTGRLQNFWNYTKEQMNDQRTMNKYFALVEQGVYITDLEVEAGISAINNSFDARIVGKDYSSVDDNLVTVTSADIRSYYNAHKERFKQVPSRDIEYVVFDMLPSDQDYLDAEKFITTLAEEFAVDENPMQYALLNSQVTPNQMYLKESQIDGAIAAAVFNNPDAMYGPELSGDVYTMARLADSRMMPDEIGAKHILLSYGQRDLADSLVQAIWQGADFEMLAYEYSMDPSARMNGGDLGEFAPEQMVPEFSNPLMDARVGDVFTVDTDFGIHVVQLTKKSEPVRKAQIATIRYKVDPSQSTQNAIYAEASRFLSNAAGSYDNFKKAATEGALSVRIARRVTMTDRSVNGLDDSRELVRWAFESKKGEVSDIKEIGGGDYIIAALTEVRNDEYAKPEEVADQIRQSLIKEKKADAIIAGINGSTLDQVASEFGSEPTEAEGVSFGTFLLDGIGVDYRLVGAITAGRPGVLSKPVRGDSGVYLYEITDMTVAEDANEESERIRLEAASTSYLGERLAQAMGEGANVKDNRVRYF